MQSQELQASGHNTETPSYAPPAVVFEAPLEVRAGSPLGIPGLADIVDPN